MELGGFSTNSDQFLINFGAKSRRFWDFEQFLQISADFDRFLHILAHPRRPPPATRARPRPAAAAGGRTLEKARKTNDFRCFARGRPCPPGSARRPSPRSAVDFCAKPADSCRFQHSSAYFCIFLNGNSLDFGSFLVISVKFLEFHHFDHFWWMN